MGHVITLARLFAMVSELLSTVRPESEASVKVLATSTVAALITSVAINLYDTANDISTLIVQTAVLVSLKGLLTFAPSSLSNAQESNARNPGTPAQQAHSAAQEIADLSPSAEVTEKDYDMVKDELWPVRSGGPATTARRG